MWVCLVFGNPPKLRCSFGVSLKQPEQGYPHNYPQQKDTPACCTRAWVKMDQSPPAAFGSEAPETSARRVRSIWIPRIAPLAGKFFRDMARSRRRSPFKQWQFLFFSFGVAKPANSRGVACLVLLGGGTFWFLFSHRQKVVPSKKRTDPHVPSRVAPFVPCFGGDALLGNCTTKTRMRFLPHSHWISETSEMSAPAKVRAW